MKWGRGRFAPGFGFFFTIHVWFCARAHVRFFVLLGPAFRVAGVIVKSVYWLIAPASVGPPFAVETGASVLEVRKRNEREGEGVC